MVNNKSFFDMHAHNHAYDRDPEFYRSLVRLVANGRERAMILDIGCGNGSFIKMVTDEGIHSQILGVDVSTSMLKIANVSLKHLGVHLIAADGFLLPLSTKYKFDIIHLDSVLHHLIGGNRSESKALAERLVKTLLGSTSDNATIIIEEILYESHIVSSLTSSLIFYGLKLVNFLKLDLQRVSRDIIPGLEVNFFTESELVTMLRRLGKIEIIKKSDLKMTKLQRLCGQKRFCHVSLLLKKNQQHPNQ